MQNQHDEPVVLIHQRDAAMWLTINRPERRNALNPEVIASLHEGILKAAATPDIRTIVLTGAGDKAFCAGADLNLGGDVFAAGSNEPTTDFGRLARTVRELGIPLIARINGACVAGGLGLMSLCDLAIASEHARFGLPEVKVGVFPMQVLVYLRRLIGARHANELCLTGSLIDAPRAAQIGLINQVVSAAQLDSSIEELCAQLALNSPVALRRGKCVIAAMESMSFEAALSYAEAQIALAARTDDAREGMAAFTQGRAPVWTIAMTPEMTHD